MTFSCKRCGYECTHKCHLLRHLNRKISCSPSVQNIQVADLIKELTHVSKSYVCKYCQNNYASPQSRYMHQKRCKAISSKSASNSSVSLNDNASLLTVVEYLIEDNKKLHEMIEKLQQPSTSTVTTTNINKGTIINNNVNVHLRDFGTENMNALPYHLIADCFMRLKHRDLLENLHFDPDFPENHNVRIKSVKRKVMEIYKNSKWNVVTMDDGIMELIHRANQILFKYGHDNKDDILKDEDLTEEEYIDVMQQLENIKYKINSAISKNVQVDLQNMLESNKSLTLLS